MLNGGNGKLSSVTTRNVCRRDGDVLLRTKDPCKRNNIVGQQLPTLLDVTDVASVCTPCCMLLDVVAQRLKPVKLFSQKLPTFLLFRDRRSVAQ